MYYSKVVNVAGEVEIVKRHGEVGAGTHKTPAGFCASHHHFSNPPSATRRIGCASRSGLRPETPRKGKNAMPRPKRAMGTTTKIQVRITDDEKSTLFIQADKAGLTLSEYVRRCSLNKRIQSHVSDKAIARLSSLCGLQKHLLMQIKGRPYEAALRNPLNSTLAEITTTLRTVIRKEDEAE